MTEQTDLQHAVAELSRDALQARVAELERRLAFVMDASAKENYEIDQILGRALRYPRYADDPKNFHESIGSEDVCTGEHVPVTLAMEAGKRIEVLERAIVDAAVPLEVLAASDAALPYREIGPELRATIAQAVLSIRAALFGDAARKEQSDGKN